MLSSRTASASLGPQHLSSRCWHALAIFQEELHLGAVQSVTGPAHHLSSRPSERWWQGPQGQHRASVACRHCALLMSLPWDGAVRTLLPSVLKMLSLLLVVPLRGMGTKRILGHPDPCGQGWQGREPTTMVPWCPLPGPLGVDGLAALCPRLMTGTGDPRQSGKGPPSQYMHGKGHLGGTLGSAGDPRLQPTEHRAQCSRHLQDSPCWCWPQRGPTSAIPAGNSPTEGNCPRRPAQGAKGAVSSVPVTPLLATCPQPLNPGG